MMPGRVFYGLSLAHTRAHLLRALLEGSAFALRDILAAMRGAGLGVRRITIVGGGAKGPLWRQIKADVTGLPVPGTAHSGSRPISLARCPAWRRPVASAVPASSTFIAGAPVLCGTPARR